MADLALPAGARVTDLPMQPDLSGIVDHRSPSTGRRSFLVRGAGRWQGTLALALHDRLDRAAGVDVAARIHAWISALAPGILSTSLPLPPDTPTLPEGTAAPVIGLTAAGALQMGGDVRARDGDFFTLAGRLYQVQQGGLDGPTRTLSVVPYGLAFRRAAIIGQPITPAASIDVRSTGGGIASPRNPDFWGPWQIPWEEVDD